MNRTTNHRKHRASRVLMSVLAGTSLMLAACGDDDDEDADTADTADTVGAAVTTLSPPVATEPPVATTAPATTEAPVATTAPAATEAPATTAAESDSSEAGAAVCAPFLDISTQLNGEPDPALLTGLIEDAEANAPDEIASSLTVMTDAVRSVLDSGGTDFSAFETPEFGEAQGIVDPWMFENCTFDNKLEVTATDYSFDGIPAEVGSGRTAVLLTNAGAEAHEVAMLRKNDGVTESWEELLALPEEEAMTKATFVGSGFAPMNGSQGLAVVDVTPGDYVAVCFVPTGSSVTADGAMTEGTGPPHFTHGMIQEFTVTS